MQKIIHIASDEKFINSAYSQFEEIYPGENLFYIIVADLDKPLIHVDLLPGMVLITSKKKEIKELPQHFNNANVICFHGMDANSSTILENTPSSYKTVWFLWGFEIHNNPLFFSKTKLAGPLTFSFYFLGTSNNKFKQALKNLYKKKIYPRLEYFNKDHQKTVQALKKADYCGILYKEEFDIVKRKLQTDIKYLNFSYYPIEKMLLDPTIWVNNNNILLGNSASYTNNHLEIFEILKKFSLSDRKILTPLSYGGEFYRTEIIKRGKELFGYNFEPLTDYLNRDEYFKILQQCGIVIMNHYRQQAVGNVMVMLWMGAKVFLDDRNSLFHYLQRINISVFSIQQDLNIENPEAFLLLDKSTQMRNREILKTQIGEIVLKQNLRQQFDFFLNEY